LKKARGDLINDGGGTQVRAKALSSAQRSGPRGGSYFQGGARGTGGGSGDHRGDLQRARGLLAFQKAVSVQKSGQHKWNISKLKVVVRTKPSGASGRSAENQQEKVKNIVHGDCERPTKKRRWFQSLSSHKVGLLRGRKET